MAEPTRDLLNYYEVLLHAKRAHPDFEYCDRLENGDDTPEWQLNNPLVGSLDGWRRRVKPESLLPKPTYEDLTAQAHRVLTSLHKAQCHPDYEYRTATMDMSNPVGQTACAIEDLIRLTWRGYANQDWARNLWYNWGGFTIIDGIVTVYLYRRKAAEL